MNRPSIRQVVECGGSAPLCEKRVKRKRLQFAVQRRLTRTKRDSTPALHDAGALADTLLASSGVSRSDGSLHHQRGGGPG